MESPSVNLLDFSYSSKEKDILLQLYLVKGVGRKTLTEVLLVLKKHEQSYGNYLGILKKNYNKNSLINKYLTDEIEQNIYSFKKRLKKLKIKVIAFWEDEYPLLLKRTEDFPLLLFIKGNSAVLNSELFAVVGTRKITSYGKMVTQKLVRELVAYNYTIVSGAMYGVDQVAHQEAIQNTGNTVAVLGYGLDYIPQPSIQKLLQEIVESGGCLVSEYLPNTAPSKGTFPQRNRIVAGMSSGVLVTEAGLQSGTHITVKCALDAGREVFAVPGSIFNLYSEGTQYLLNQGAKCVGSALDIVAEFKKVITIPSSLDPGLKAIDMEELIESLSLDSVSKKIIKELLYLPQSTNALSQKTNLPITELLTILGMLELENIIENEAGIWHCVLSYSSH